MIINQHNPSRFNKKQLYFIANVMFTSCIDTVESALPQHKNDIPFVPKESVKDILSTALQSLGWNLSILYAQLNDDGMAVSEAIDASKIESHLNNLINDRYNGIFQYTMKDGSTKIHIIDATQLARNFIDQNFNYYFKNKAKYANKK